MEESTTIQQIQGLLDRFQAGDERARDEMINLACRRLTLLSRKMFRDYPRLRQWEQTDDVTQNAVVRLQTALSATTPRTPQEFFGLASLQIRRVLLDMTRSIYGRRNQAAPREPDGENRGPNRPMTFVGSPRDAQGDEQQTTPVADPGEISNDPGKLAVWTEFHQVVERLPDDLRCVVDLLFYQELPQSEAAVALGVSVRTIKRRWQQARQQLHEAVSDWLM